MIPLRDENPSRRVPVVTRVLIVINALVFMWEVSLGEHLRAAFFDFGFVPQRLTLALQGETAVPPTLATLLSSMFMHGGWLHLIGNMWYLWIFGDNVEDRLGHVPNAGFYLGGGLAAAALQYVVQPGSMIPMVGASGAIAAVLGGYALAFPRARVLTLVPLFFMARVTVLPALLVLGLWFVLQFFSGAMSLGSVSGGTAWWAHIGGFLFGIAVMLPFARRGGGGPRRLEFGTD